MEGNIEYSGLNDSELLNEGQESDRICMTMMMLMDGMIDDNFYDVGRELFS
jgi:hypothetical protein